MISWLNYHVNSRWWSVQDAYANWIATREPQPQMADAHWPGVR